MAELFFSVDDFVVFFFQAEDGIRDRSPSRGLGDVYKRQEYDNNTHKAEQALPAWRGAARSSRDTKLLLSSSDGARSCRIRLRFPLLFC